MDLSGNLLLYELDGEASSENRLPGNFRSEKICSTVILFFFFFFFLMWDPHSGNPLFWPSKAYIQYSIWYTHYMFTIIMVDGATRRRLIRTTSCSSKNRRPQIADRIRSFHSILTFDPFIRSFDTTKERFVMCVRSILKCKKLFFTGDALRCYVCDGFDFLCTVGLLGEKTECPSDTKNCYKSWTGERPLC